MDFSKFLTRLQLLLGINSASEAPAPHSQPSGGTSLFREEFPDDIDVAAHVAYLETSAHNIEMQEESLRLCFDTLVLIRKVNSEVDLAVEYAQVERLTSCILKNAFTLLDMCTLVELQLGAGSLLYPYFNGGQGPADKSNAARELLFTEKASLARGVVVSRARLVLATQKVVETTARLRLVNTV